MTKLLTTLHCDSFIFTPCGNGAAHRDEGAMAIATTARRHDFLSHTNDFPTHTDVFPSHMGTRHTLDLTCS